MRAASFPFLSLGAGIGAARSSIVLNRTGTWGESTALARVYSDLLPFCWRRIQGAGRI